MRFPSLQTLAIAGGVYDLALALPMLAFPLEMSRLFGAPTPVPILNAQLNGLFTLTLAIGYFWCAANIVERRGYLWVAGVFVKLAGALLFVGDHFLRGSPSAFLLFAATDGSIGLVTLAALLGEGGSASGRSVRG